jgi:hypothetical protein
LSGLDGHAVTPFSKARGKKPSWAWLISVRTSKTDLFGQCHFTASSFGVWRSNFDMTFSYPTPSHTRSGRRNHHPSREAQELAEFRAVGNAVESAPGGYNLNGG